MIMAYGQDDRVCAYTSAAAMFEMKEVLKTACCLLVDKEEIGSVGATLLQDESINPSHKKQDPCHFHQLLSQPFLHV